MSLVAMPHQSLMREALAEARLGGQQGNLAVGALVVRDGAAVARGHNEVVSTCDPTAHAEIVVLRRAAEALGSPLLTGCVLYTTVEPCIMCAAAIAWARIDTVVIGTRFPRSGGVVSKATVIDTMAAIVHRVEVITDVLAEECLALIPVTYR